MHECSLTLLTSGFMTPNVGALRSMVSSARASVDQHTVHLAGGRNGKETTRQHTHDNAASNKPQEKCTTDQSSAP
jgi:hypothetical protein